MMEEDEAILADIEREEEAIRLEQRQESKANETVTEVKKCNVSSLESFDDFEAMLHNILLMSIKQQKLMLPEYWDKWRIVLVARNSWDDNTIHYKGGDIITVVLPYKRGEFPLLLDKSYHGKLFVLSNWKRAISETVPRLLKLRAAPFQPVDKWVRMQQEGRKLIREKLHARVSDLFDIAELGRVSVECTKTITVHDKFTGYEETITIKERMRPSDLPEHEQISISERLKMLDEKRFDTKDENELLAREIQELAHLDIRG